MSGKTKAAQAAPETAPSLGADILAAGVPTGAEEVEATPQADYSEGAVLTPEASEAEPPIEDQAPRAPVAATDYSAIEAQRHVHPAAREPQGQRYSNVGKTREVQPAEILFVDVLLKRDLATTIPKTVPVYALPILERIHETVEVIAGSERHIKVDRFDPAEEYNMLQRRYDSKVKEHVREVYPMGPRQIAEIVGVPMWGSGKFEQRQSEQNIRPREGQVLRNRS